MDDRRHPTHNDDGRYSPEGEGEFGRPAPGTEGNITVRTTQRQEFLESLGTDEVGYAPPGPDGTGTGDLDRRDKQAQEQQLAARRTKERFERE